MMYRSFSYVLGVYSNQHYTIEQSAPSAHEPSALLPMMRRPTPSTYSKRLLTPNSSPLIGIPSLLVRIILNEARLTASYAHATTC